MTANVIIVKQNAVSPLPGQHFLSVVHLILTRGGGNGALLAINDLCIPTDTPSPLKKKKKSPSYPVSSYSQKGEKKN